MEKRNSLLTFALGLFTLIQPITCGATLSSSSPTHIDYILVEKSKHLMSVFYQNQLMKTYRIALGFSPLGHKMQEGDGKTPEGSYQIVSKNPASKFHLSLKLSYPSLKDVKNAHQHGVKPGSNIMIHGLSVPYQNKGKAHTMKDWTLGCIALTNEEIEEIYHYASIGTTVEIIP